MAKTAKGKTKAKAKTAAPNPQSEVAAHEDSIRNESAVAPDQAKQSQKVAEDGALKTDGLNTQKSADGVHEESVTGVGSAISEISETPAKPETSETQAKSEFSESSESSEKSKTPEKVETETKTEAKSVTKMTSVVASKPVKYEQKKVVLRSPLANKSGGEFLQMKEIVGQTLINLRGKTDDEAFVRAVQNSLGALPVVANTTAAIDNGVVFWLGPDEWQVRFESPPAAQVLTGLQQSLANVHAAYTEVSDYYTIIRIAGVYAHDALAAACPLDLHTLRQGDCAQSHYAKAAVLLYQKDDAPTFDLQVRWSYAEYVWQYLCVATGDL